MVDRGGLENRCALAGTQGSNPCLSAKKVRKRKLSDLRAKKGGMRTLMGSLSRSACGARNRVALAKQESLSFRKEGPEAQAFGPSCEEKRDENPEGFVIA